MQSLDVLQVAKRLAGIAADSRSQHLRKSRRVVGMIHELILDELLAVDDLRSGKGREYCFLRKHMNYIAVHLK